MDGMRGLLQRQQFVVGRRLQSPTSWEVQSRILNPIPVFPEYPQCSDLVVQPTKDVIDSLHIRFPSKRIDQHHDYTYIMLEVTQEASRIIVACITMLLHLCINSRLWCGDSTVYWDTPSQRTDVRQVVLTLGQSRCENILHIHCIAFALPESFN